MRHNGQVSKKYHRTRIPVIFLIVVLLVAIGAGTWVAQYTKNPTYWLTAAVLVVTLVGLFLGSVKRAADQRLDVRLDEAADTLARAATAQWRDELGHRLTNPELHVPFAVTPHSRKVTDAWGAIPRGKGAKSIELKGTSDNIADVFMRADVPSRLVVLGSEGSGKSVIAQRLTLELLKRRELRGRGGKRAVKQRMVPVFLPVASWDPEKDLDDWVAAQMIETYPSLGEIIQAGDGTARSLASELVAERRVLVILDGLDEITREYRAKALAKLSVAVKEDYSLVVTCRTRDYHEIVAEAGPLARTPVVELSPLSVSAVRAHFREASENKEWSGLIRHLKTEPDGALAVTLTTPLGIWLMRTVYQNRGSAAVNLIGKHPAEIRQHLLDGLVEATYTAPASHYPRRDEKQVRRARRTLTYLARYLAAEKEQQRDDVNIAWWRLHEKVPRAVIGLSVGLTVGCVLGVAVGVAVTIKSGASSGLLAGGVFALATGVLSGITCMRPQPAPRLVNIGFSWIGLPGRLAGCLSVGLAVGLAFGYAADHGGGLRYGLITAIVVGPVCAAAAIPAFGLAPGITAGITAALAVGLAAGLASGRPGGTVAGPVAGVVFMAASWVWIGLYRSARTDLAMSPDRSLSNDRNGCLVVGATAGVAFGVVYGLALGPLVGGVAVAALFIAVVITVSLWGTFSVAVLWLSVVEGIPVRFMSFLHEAHARGMLRQAGGHYQFRHDLLQRQLATAASAHVKAPGKRTTAEQNGKAPGKRKTAEQNGKAAPHKRKAVPHTKSAQTVDQRPKPKPKRRSRQPVL